MSNTFILLYITPHRDSMIKLLVEYISCEVFEGYLMLLRSDLSFRYYFRKRYKINVVFFYLRCCFNSF